MDYEQLKKIRDRSPNIISDMVGHRRGRQRIIARQLDIGEDLMSHIMHGRRKIPWDKIPTLIELTNSSEDIEE